MHENYNLIFRNIAHGTTRINIKEVHGIDVPHFMFSPLSEYIYLTRYYESIDDVLNIVNDVLTGTPYYGGIELGTETINISQNSITITLSDGKMQTLPTIDFKAILEEFKIFLNTPPLSGQKVK